MNTLLTGKNGELLVVRKLIQRGLNPYLPSVDMEGVDCLIKRGDGQYVDLQIKTSGEGNSDPLWFQVRNLQPRDNLVIVCIEPTDICWVIPSREFARYSTVSNGIYDLKLDARGEDHHGVWIREQKRDDFKEVWKFYCQKLKLPPKRTSRYLSLRRYKEAWDVLYFDRQDQVGRMVPLTTK